MSFANLKKNSKSGFKVLSEKMSQETKGGSYEDSRFWTPDIDKSGSGVAVIRFLPACEGEEYPFVKTYSHGFKQGSKWFVEDCPTTIGLPCPVCDANSALWATEIKENQDIVRRRKRQTRYISNILVLSDQKRPQNEGKVFLFSYGAKIFEKLMDAIEPQFADEKAFNPFDFWEGAPFKMKIRNVEGYRNYDKSEFGDCGPVFKDDSAMEDLWKMQHPLQEFLQESKFKSYSEIQKRFNSIINSSASQYQMIKDESEGDDVPFEPTNKTQRSTTPMTSRNRQEDDLDDDLKLYSSLIDD